MGGLEKRWLLIRKGNKPKRSRCLFFCQKAVQRKDCGHAGGIVIRTRGSIHGVVVGTDDHYLVRLVRSGDLHLDIRAGHSCNLVFLAVDLATRLGKRNLKIVSRSGEASV